MASYRVNLKKIKRKKGFIYQLDYRVGTKRIRRFAGSNFKEAETLRAKLQHELLFDRHKLDVPTKAVQSLHSLVKEFLQTKKREVRSKSLVRYEIYLNRLDEFFKKYFPDGHANIRRISKAHIQEFIEKISNGKKPWANKTLNGFIRLGKSLFQTAVEEKYIEENPFEHVKEFRLPSPGMENHFTIEQLNKIWNEVDPHWRPALEFMYHTGLRKGEMINLTWENVKLDPENPSISVVSLDDWETKTGANRTIPLDARALEILKSIKNKHVKYVFLGVDGKKIHPDRPYHALKTALKNLGLEGDVHKLRHTFASHLAMAGKDILSIMELMGHKDIKTTQIYARPDKHHLKEVVTALDTKPKDKAA